MAILAPFIEIELISADVLPTPAEACAAAGYPEGGAPPYFLGVAEAAIAEAGTLAAPRAGYVLVAAPPRSAAGPLSPSRRVALDGASLSTGAVIAEELAGAEAAAVFLCGLGSGPEDRVRALMEADDGPEAFIMDAVASLMAERAAERVHAAVAAAALSSGWGVTERYSPGYCGWPVSDQRSLFSLLPPGALGIELTESSLMRPVKSVSGIIGAGPGLARRGYRCDVCGRKDCTYRNKTLESKHAAIGSRNTAIGSRNTAIGSRNTAIKGESR